MSRLMVNGAAKDLLREAQDAGFAITRNSGGHIILCHSADGRSLVIPTHPKAYQGTRGRYLVLSVRKTIQGKPSRGLAATLVKITGLALVAIMLFVPLVQGQHTILSPAVFMVVTEDRATHRPAYYGSGFFTDALGTAFTATHNLQYAIANPSRYRLMAYLPSDIQREVQVICYESKIVHAAGIVVGRDVAIIRVLDEPSDGAPALSLAITTPLAGSVVSVIGYGYHNDPPHQRQEDGIITRWDIRNGDGVRILTMVFPGGHPTHGDSGSPVFDSKGLVVGIYDWEDKNDNLTGYAVAVPDVRCEP